MNEGQIPDPTPETAPPAFQPGQTIQPGGAVAPAPSSAAPSTPALAETPVAATAETPDPSQESQPAESYADQAPITWTAAEFIAHDKSAGWYGVLALVGISIAALVYLIARDAISTAVVLVCTVLFGVYAARKPRQIDYQLDDLGISIGRRQYSFHEFRSFSFVDEGPLASIVFMPLKRFAPLLSVYFDPANEEPIATVLADHLPVEVHKLDLLERLLKAVRF